MSSGSTPRAACVFSLSFAYKNVPVSSHIYTDTNSRIFHKFYFIASMPEVISETSRVMAA